MDVKSYDEIGVMSDNFNMMTERLKYNIKELEGLKKGLEKEVEKRAYDLRLANVKLESAYNDLKKLDEMKTNFLSAVSHDISTPIDIGAGVCQHYQAFFPK